MCLTIKWYYLEFETISRWFLINALEICMQYDFGRVNPVGNKTPKHNFSAFNFVLRNFSFKYWSRLK